MKILHIWDVAGVSCVLAKFQRLNGHKVHVIGRANHDPFGFLSYYAEDRVELDGDDFRRYCVRMADRFDVVHIHDLPDIHKIIPDRIKKILHYHGRKDTEIQPDLISTPNLLEYYPNAKVLPTPIDTELFKRQQLLGHGAITFQIRYNNAEAFDDYVKPLNIKIKKHNRDQFPIKHWQIPNILKFYKYYVDVKFDNYSDGVKLAKALSKTALEALSMGLIVIDYNLQKVKRLPEEHRAENVVKILDGFY